MSFFLQGVFETAQLASATAQRLLRLFDDDRARLQGLRRGAGSALDLSKTAIHSALDHLQKFGIVREMTGKQRYRLYVYDAYLSLLDEGTEPLER